MMTIKQVILVTFIMALITVITRAVPFVFFKNRKPPKILDRIELTVPAAVMVILTIYCLKNVDLSTSPNGLAEAAAVITTALLHIWRKNALLSISAGTGLYMLLINYFF